VLTELVINVNKHTNTQGLKHVSTRVLEAELESRKSATQRAQTVYERAGCLEETHCEQLDMFFDGISRDVSITAMSTRGNPEFISGNVKNYARKLGNLTGVREILGISPVTATVPTPTSIDVPEMVTKYLSERGQTSSAFRTQMFLVEVGTHKGNPFGIVVKPNGSRYAIGNLVGKGVQAFKQTSRPYKNVDKATKGHRAKFGNSVVVYTPAEE